MSAARRPARPSPPQPPQKTGGLSPRVLWAGFLIAATLAAYGPALKGGYLWDDDVYVVNNPLLTAPDGLRRIWFSKDSPSQYFPLTYTALRLERSLWGLDTLGYHLVNLALHVANALLLWQILELLAIPGAWLAAAIFALHPVHVESVAWITERKNVLSTFFYLLALRAWAASFGAPASVKRWGQVMILYALALFSKTTACTLPAALVLAAWIKKEPLDRRRRLQIASFLAVGVAMGLLTVWWERNVQKTSGHQFQLTKPEALIVAGRALWFYAGKLLWPSGLTFSYPRWPVGGDWRLWLWPASALAAAAGLAESWRRGRRAPAIAFLFFASALSPLLGFIPLYTFQYAFAADHYQYVASMGLIALFAAAAALKLAPSEPSVPRAHPAALLLLAVLGVLTWNRASAFAGAEPLWRDTLRKNPASWMSYENLACVLIEQKRLPEAETLLKTSLALKPDEFRTHYDLGFLYDLERRAPEALAEYEEALRLEPRHLNSRYKLAHLLSSLGRDEEASAQYRQALATDPDNAQTRYAFGLLLSRRNRLDDAVAQYREAVRLDPRYYPAHNNLGNALQRLNRPDEALAEYRTALAIEPGFPEAHFNLALMLEKAGRLEEAAAEYSVALQLKQDFAAARQRLNAVRAGLLRSGRPLPGI